MTQPATQKALFVDKKLGDFVFRETEVCTPGPGELLVRVLAAALNPVDWKIHKMGLFIEAEKYPVILGADVAGEVVKLGEGVRDFEVGDRVFCRGRLENAWSGFQQYTLLQASTTAKIPPNITYEQASALPVALTISYIALYNVAPHGLGFKPPVSEETQGIYAGTPIVVLGGASSVGQLVLQLLRLSGFSPIITTASSKHTKFLTELGATHVLDRNTPPESLISKINEITGGKPILHVVDTISLQQTQQSGIDILASGGKLALVLPVLVEVPVDKTAFFAVGVLRLPHNIELLETLYHDKIYGWLEKGVIKANNVEVLPNGLAGIPDGLDRMQSDKVSGLKLVARPQETP